ncbi:MAG: FG-GAP-like repeat-containing protein [Candidatus Zixiibacteriota bacterium]
MRSIQKKVLRLTFVTALCAAALLINCSNNPEAPDKETASDQLLLEAEFSWTGVVLTWNRLDRAICSAYLVQRSETLDGDFVTTDTLDAFECACVDRALVANATYRYRLIALDNDNNQTIVSNLDTAIVSGSTLLLSDTALIFASGGGESPSINVLNGTVRATFDWTATESSDWFSLTAASGTTPEGFAIDALANTTGSDRSATVTVTADGIGESPQTLRVVQPVAGNILCPSADELATPPLGGTNPELSVFSCSGVPICNWVAESDADWLTVLPDSGASPTDLSLVAQPNRTGAARSCQISITPVGLVEPADVITITQDRPFRTPVSYSATGTPISVCTADFDGDGDKDLAVVHSDAAYVSIFANAGDGTFGAASNFAISGAAKWVRAADLDNDGDVDLACILASGSGYVILFNAGSGTFTSVSTTLNENLTRMALADCDNDGDRDLVTTNRVTGDALVLVNDGTGTFSQLVRKSLGAAPENVCVFDINNAGYLDILSANTSSDSVSMLTSSGLLTYNTAVKFLVEDQPVSLCSGDFNADTRADAAVVCKGAGSVRIMQNTGTSGAARFTNAGVLPVVSEPNSICSADLDADGDTDIAASGWGISVLVNAGGGVFASAIELGPTAEYMNDICAGDFDGDTDVDLAVTNETAGAVLVIINNTK